MGGRDPFVGPFGDSVFGDYAELPNGQTCHSPAGDPLFKVQLNDSPWAVLTKTQVEFIAEHAPWATMVISEENMGIFGKEHEDV